jgi:hypothetical protein
MKIEIIDHQGIVEHNDKYYMFTILQCLGFIIMGVIIYFVIKLFIKLMKFLDKNS